MVMTCSSKPMPMFSADDHSGENEQQQLDALYANPGVKCGVLASSVGGLQSKLE